MIAYILRGHDNNAYFFSDDSKGITCEACGTCLDYGYVPREIDMQPSKKYDVSTTYDGRMLYSAAFVDFCKTELQLGEEFIPISCGSGTFYYMFPARIIRFDVTRRHTRFLNACNKCGGYESIVGATPAFLDANLPIGHGFFRTDIAFGSGKEKFPLILIDPENKEKMQTKCFRGLELLGIQP